MAFIVRPHPEFSWSHSRDKMFQDCQRKYWNHYYLSWNGWLSDAPAESRLAYVLKRLTTYQIELGQAIHRRAKESGLAVQRGSDRPTLEQMREQTRRELNAVWTSSKNRAAFLSRPKHNPMLHGSYYDEPISEHHLEKVRERMERCLMNLDQSGVWRELVACGPDEIFVVDTTASFVINGLTLYAAPDLLYRRSGVWTLLDWKTGTEEGADDQVGLYALYLRDGLGVPLTSRNCRGRIVNLDDGGDRTINITLDDVDDAEARVQSSVSRMRALVADGDLQRNEALAKGNFALRNDRSACRWCPFRELCGAVLTAEVASA